MKWDRGKSEPGGEDKIWNEEKHGGGRKTEIGGSKSGQRMGRSRRTARAKMQGKLTSKQKRKEEKEKRGLPTDPGLS